MLRRLRGHSVWHRQLLQVNTAQVLSLRGKAGVLMFIVFHCNLIWEFELFLLMKKTKLTIHMNYF